MATDRGTQYPWALIIAEVVRYDGRGNLTVRLMAPDGKDFLVELDTSNAAPISDEAADEIAAIYKIDVPR
ncbi:MAG: hypothetical protein OXF79_07810 [Chloroflexi bacterium]|nr:hypothetical protein [Chloroflexota bacterium]